VEFVVIMGALVALVFGAIQVGLVYYGRAVVMAAANRGAQVASTAGGSDAGGQQAADAALATLGGLARTSSAQVAASGGEVTSQASASVVSIVPFLPDLTVRAAVTMHQELAAGG
jgi:Flp pilus assembly protein TadG